MSGQMALVTIAALRMEVRELKARNEKLASVNERYMVICNYKQIVELYDEYSQISVYRKYFIHYRKDLLGELESRYYFTVDNDMQNLMTQVQPIDEHLIKRLLNKIGNECKQGEVKSMFGTILITRGG
jgi:FtsZ-binding cell division protein ZapB